MDVCSPKDGFVVAVHVKSGDRVKEGADLLTMDDYDERKAEERLNKIERVRRDMALQYTGEELKVARRLASISVASAVAAANATDNLYEFVTTQHQLGKATLGDAYEMKLRQEQNSHQKERAELELQKFDISTQRHLRINQILENHIATERRLLEIRKHRLKMVAPVTGKVKLLVGVNAFAAMGAKIAEIG